MTVAALLRLLALCTTSALLLLGSGTPAAVDELQDINKLIGNHQFEPALERLNVYLVAHPKDAQARFLKGTVLAEQGKPNEAIPIFSALTEDYPELPEPYNNLAVIYAAQGQYEKARNALELAIHTHPSYGTAHENLGDVYAKLASKAYDKALQQDKNNTSAQAKLSLIRSLFEVRPGAGAATAPMRPVAVARADTPVEPVHAAEPAAALRSGSANPVPAAAPRAADAKDSNPEVSAIADTVRSWAAAWSAKSPDSYLAFYADDFRTPNGESRADWEKLRRDRLAKPGPIEVELLNLNVNLNDKDTAQVSFRQKYSSYNLKAINQKTLILRHAGDKWVIVEERVRG